MLYTDFHWAILLLAIPCYYLQLYMHEWSHCYVAEHRCYYQDVRLSLFIWPQRIKQRWLLAMFTFDRGSPLLIHPQEYRMWIAPAKLSLAVAIPMAAGAIFLHWAFLPSAVYAAIDAAWFWKGYLLGSDQHDGGKYRRLKGKYHG